MNWLIEVCAFCALVSFHPEIMILMTLVRFINIQEISGVTHSGYRCKLNHLMIHYPYSFCDLEV